MNDDGRLEHVELASRANALSKFYLDVGIIRKSGEAP